MDWEQRCMRLCAAVLISAALLRLVGNGSLAVVGEALNTPETASFLVYLQTGRVVRLGKASDTPVVLDPVEWTAATAPVEPVRFSAGDAALVSVKYNCEYRPDLGASLTEPLAWDLTGDEPAVLILHTHTTESYTKGSTDTYQETSAYRTLDPGYNMLCIGEIVAEMLEEAGITVIHDTNFHDYPSYNGSYSDAAASTRAILEEYPSIQLVIDLHRDAADTSTGQLSTACTVGGKSAAQIMFVVGTDERLTHPDWRDNLSLALKLQVLLEQDNPGICRSMNLTRQRYNQHLGGHALLVEIGAAGDTLDEAKLAARELAEAIIQLKYGATSG